MATESKMPVVFDTPDGIELYRLASIRGRIKLEASGLRARGKSTRALVAAELGLTARTPHKVFIDLLTDRINALKAKILQANLIVEEMGTDKMVKACDRSCLIMQNLESEADEFKVFYYIAEVPNNAQEPTIHTSEAEALDAAQKFVLEVR